jgi:hypothetical protein
VSSPCHFKRCFISSCFIGNRFLCGFRRPTVLSRVLPLLCVDEGALSSDLSLHKAGAFTARETQVSYKLLVQYLNVCV